MPSYPCRWPTCTAYVPKRWEFCAEHQERGARDMGGRHRFYDEHLRDREAKRFYASASWHRARAKKLARNPVCEREGCGVFAEHVHHIIPLRQCNQAQKTDQANLMSLCVPCHNAETAKEQRCS